MGDVIIKFIMLSALDFGIDPYTPCMGPFVYWLRYLYQERMNTLPIPNIVFADKVLQQRLDLWLFRKRL